MLDLASSTALGLIKVERADIGRLTVGLGTHTRYWWCFPQQTFPLLWDGRVSLDAESQFLGLSGPRIICRDPCCFESIGQGIERVPLREGKHFIWGLLGGFPNGWHRSDDRGWRLPLDSELCMCGWCSSDSTGRSVTVCLRSDRMILAASSRQPSAGSCG